jgi:hypothetical protein
VSLEHSSLSRAVAAVCVFVHNRTFSSAPLTRGAEWHAHPPNCVPREAGLGGRAVRSSGSGARLCPNAVPVFFSQIDRSAARLPAVSVRSAYAYACDLSKTAVYLFNPLFPYDTTAASPVDPVCSLARSRSLVRPFPSAVPLPSSTAAVTGHDVVCLQRRLRAVQRQLCTWPSAASAVCLILRGVF